MLLRRLRLLLLILSVMVLVGAAPALGWANGPDGGDGYGTHDWVIHEANRISALQGCEWANMAIAQPASDDPDTVLADTVHHVYDIWGPSSYGNAPARVALLYQEAVRKLKAGDAAGASRSVGLLSHYYADICNPLHTDQDPEEDAIHASYEDDVEALTDTVGENRAWLAFDGYRPVWDPAYKAARAAERAHADYALLLQQYAAYGYNDTVDAITRRAVNLAVNGLVDILISIGRDAGLRMQALPFDASLAMTHIKALAEDIGVRTGGSENEAAAARYARTYLRSLGYSVVTVPVALPNGLVTHNLRAVKKGASPLSVLVGGHLDGLAASPGANDNASGVATVPELARDLRYADTTATIEVVLFGAEEVVDSTPGHHHYGARVFVAEMTAAERANLAGMMSVDMIAYGTTFRVGSMKRGPQLLCDNLIGYANTHGLPATFQLDEGTSGWSDHEPFELAGFPVVGWSGSDDPAYHTPADTYGHCDPAPVQKTGDLLLGFLMGLGRADLEQLRAAR